MTRRGSFWITGFALLTWILPGCTHLAGLLPGAHSKDASKDHGCCGSSAKDQLKHGEKQDKTGKDGPTVDQKKPWADPPNLLPPDAELQQHPLPDVPNPGALSQSQDKQGSFHAYPMIGTEPGRIWQASPPSPGDKQATDIVVGPAPLGTLGPPVLPTAEEKKEPLLVAMEKFLLNRPEDAVELLKDYDETRQDVFLRLLPVLAQMTQKKLEDLGADETTVLYQQLDGLLASLRSRTDLLIDRMCFCEEISPLGVCKPLREGYQFQARRGQQLGDLMRVYVQFRNLGSMKNGSVYQSQLCSSVEIVDERGERQWFKSFDEEDEKPLCFPTPRHDPHTSYAVYVPAIPPGNYTLTLRVRDMTRPELNRTTQKSLQFRVRS